MPWSAYNHSLLLYAASMNTEGLICGGKCGSSRKEACQALAHSRLLTAGTLAYKDSPWRLNRRKRAIVQATWVQQGLLCHYGIPPILYCALILKYAFWCLADAVNTHLQGRHCVCIYPLSPLLDLWGTHEFCWMNKGRFTYQNIHVE